MKQDVGVLRKSAAVLGGLGAGFVLGWLAAWLYWRRWAEHLVGYIQGLEDELGRKELALAQLEPARIESPGVERVDDLTAIKGIGPAYQARLRAGGITSFAQLASATPEHIEALLPQRRKVDAAAWIAQARQLAA